MVFQKPYKTGSCLHDVLAYENGDETCTVGALDIDGNRVGTGEDKAKGGCKGSSEWGIKKHSQEHIDKIMSTGRFPSQAFVTTETAEILDKQSGVLSSGAKKANQIQYNNNSDTFITNLGASKNEYEASQGGASKILHKCDFETADFDLFVYEPKVSASERNAGCEGFELGEAPASARSKPAEGRESALGKPRTNSHPTLKPISLNYQITKLFKTPNYQTVLVPFSGAGSELIGLFKAGFENIKGCELNPEYVEIAKARVKHHCEDLFNQNVLIE
jgi:site-specific DNA-methyltransferase (adenine-specific)